MWMMAGFYRDQVKQAGDVQTPIRYHPYSEMGDDERRAFDEVVKTVVENRPAVIVVETGREKWGLGGLTLDFIEYFSADAKFKDALSGYRAKMANGRYLALALDGESVIELGTRNTKQVSPSHMAR
jgi:hypothetical protein